MMAGKALASLVIAAAVVTGCSLEPVFHRPQPPVDAIYPQGNGYTSSAGPQRGQPGAVAAADLGWRDFLRDPRLQRLVELALKNNRDLRVAVLNVESARAQYGVARSALFPTVAANAAGVRGRGSISQFEPGNTVGTAYEAYASVSWVLDLFGKFRSLEHVALNQYLASAEARKSAELLLVSEIASQYLTLVAADEALKVTAGQLKVADESFKLTQLRFTAGVGSELDLREAEGALEQARTQLAAEQRARAQAENALVLLVGASLPSDLPQGLSLAEQNILSDIPAGLPSDLLIRRPDIAQAENQLRAANANIGAARAAFFPSISLTGVAGAVSPVLGKLFEGGTGAWSVAPAVTLPLFTGGLNTANLEQAKAQREIAVAQYEKAVQTAFRSVADALTARATYEDQTAAAARLVKAQRRRFELAQLRYKTGVDSYLTLLTAQTDLYSAELSLVSTSLNRLTNLVTLYQDLGGGWIERQGETPRSSISPP